MAHFIATGIISTDIVRKETRNGVLATSRLAVGPAGYHRLWIDIEAWGHLAGTIHHHGTRDQQILVAGRLAQRSWQDPDTGQARHRYVVVARDIDLPHTIAWAPERANTLLISGIVDTDPTARTAGAGTVASVVAEVASVGAAARRSLPHPRFRSVPSPSACDRARRIATRC